MLVRKTDQSALDARRGTACRAQETSTTPDRVVGTVLFEQSSKGVEQFWRSRLVCRRQSSVCFQPDAPRYHTASLGIRPAPGGKAARGAAFRRIGSCLGSDGWGSSGQVTLVLDAGGTSGRTRMTGQARKPLVLPDLAGFLGESCPFRTNRICTSEPCTRHERPLTWSCGRLSSLNRSFRHQTA